MKVVACLAMLVLAASAVVAAMDPPQLLTANGRVTSVNSAAGSFVVDVMDPKGAGRTVTFVLADDSKIVKAGAGIGLVDLKQGDKVNVSYQAKDGRNVVVNIGVETKM